MSLLVKLKNKLQDPILYETKLREFDECMLLLRNENAELHKRIDQLEALCRANVNTQRTYVLDERIGELEEENGRLFAENQCQRREYVQFLDQLSTMVIRTAVMQENIRKECASIYHVIGKLSSLTTNAIQSNHLSEMVMKERKTLAIDNQVLHSSPSSSSSFDSWTCDRNMNTTCLIKNKSTDQQALQRSETFIISKLPSSPPSVALAKQKLDSSQTSQKMTTKSTVLRPSRLPCRRPDSKVQSPTISSTNRSLSTPKTTKVPIRIATSLNREKTPMKKPTILISTAAKNSTTTKKPIRTSSAIQPATNRARTGVVTTTMKKNTNNQTSAASNSNKCTNMTSQAMNSTSSESSIEEQQVEMKELLPIVQDEGYSTWSSTDVKDDVSKSSVKNNEADDRQKNIGLVKVWLDDNANNQFLNKPVTEVENDKLKEFTEEFSNGSLFLCPFVRNRYSNIAPIPLTSTSVLFPPKDISLDSLDSANAKQDLHNSSSSSSSCCSSSIFSCPEAFEKILITQPDDATDDTSSSASTTFDMSAYIEDHFIDDNDNTSNETSSIETTVFDESNSSKPQKRLLFPGVLNRLIFFRRILSDSDLQRKAFVFHENEHQLNVYHANTINEHSVEVHLVNTYGSDTELQVWSHDCAEQRRFLDERQQQQQQQPQPSYQEVEIQSTDDQQLAVERQMLLQQIFEYPWLRPDNDPDRPTSINDELSLASPTSDLMVPSHNPDFYQLCALTNSSLLALSPDRNIEYSIAPTTSSIL